MAVAHTMPDQVLGLHPDHTVDLLKKQLGVKQLNLVVMTGVEEYRELLIEAQPKRWSWRKRIAITILAVVLLALVAGIFHPGARIDKFVRPYDYLGVH